MDRVEGERDVLLRGRRVRLADSGTSQVAPLRNEGDTLVLLHGCAFDHHQWNALSERLVGRHRVVAIDAPGHGGSAEIPANASILRAYAEVVLDVVATLELGRVALVGHSFGAAVGLLLATEHPEFVSRLVLISPFANRRPLRVEHRLATVPIFPSSIAMRWLRARALRDHRGGVESPEEGGSARGLLERWHQADRVDAASRAAFRTISALHADRTLDAQLARLRTPTALIFGRNDPLTIAALAPRLAREIGALRLDVLDTEHTPERELPDAVAQIVDQFVRFTPSAASTSSPVTKRPRIGTT